MDEWNVNVEMVERGLKSLHYLQYCLQVFLSGDWHAFRQRVVPILKKMTESIARLSTKDDDWWASSRQDPVVPSKIESPFCQLTCPSSSQKLVQIILFLQY